MKRISLLIISLMTLVAANAQFTVTSSAEHVMLTDPQYNIDAIVIFNTIPVGTMLNYTGTGNIVWSYTISGETFTSTQQSIEPENGVLYTVSQNGTPIHYVYVIDHSLYPIRCTGVITDADMTDPCNISAIDVTVSATDLIYYDRNNQQRTLPRYFYIAYTTSSWTGTEWQDSAAVTTAPVVGNTAQFRLSPPILRDCLIAAYGDNFAVDMGLSLDTCYGDFTAVAIQPHPKGTVIERDAKNEKDRSSSSAIQGSAPLVVQLKANVNPVASPYVEWFVWNVNDSLGYLHFIDESVNYTFEETGDYKARVLVRNGNCTYTETLDIKTLESFIEVPNVFTPNDDGINDEFRVAFKSIREFDIWIYNRWGRLVYHSSDPGKGWDGRINGKPASVGTYYYIINAYGEDTDDDGDRIHYKLSGDCNLLR